jgi:hypothetical protein
MQQEIFLFTKVSRPVLGLTQPPIQLVAEAICPAVKWLGHEADHSPTSSVTVKNKPSYHSTPPTCLHVMPLIASDYTERYWVNTTKVKALNTTLQVPFYLSVGSVLTADSKLSIAFWWLPCSMWWRPRRNQAHLASAKPAVWVTYVSSSILAFCKQQCYG